MQIHFRIFFFTLALFTLSLISCEGKLDAEIPSFLEIESFDYRGNFPESIPYSNEYKSVNISDAWVSMNGQFIGCFEIPCKIPILSDGANTFYISPGIKSSGQSANRIIYPYYEKDTIEIDLQILKTFEYQIPFSQYYLIFQLPPL